MTRVAIFGFGAVALSLHLFLHYYLEPKFKPYVSERFIERSDTIPETTEIISESSLRGWINNHPIDAKNYLFPIIFPIDFLFMMTLAGFLALASLALAETLPFLRAVPFWVWIVAPGLYLVADFWEDTLMMWVLSASSRLDGATFLMLRAATALKLFVVKVALVEVAILFVLALGRRAYTSLT